MNLLLHGRLTKKKRKGKGRRTEFIRYPGQQWDVQPDRRVRPDKTAAALSSHLGEIFSEQGAYFLLVLSFTRKTRPLVIKTVRVTSKISIIIVG
jgi:hypothetical protein